MSREPTPSFSVEGAALNAWETSDAGNEENVNAGAKAVAERTLLDLKKQLASSATALKQAKKMISSLRSEKKALKEKNDKLTGQNTQVLASLESTKQDALAISSSLNDIQTQSNKTKNDKDVMNIQLKDARKRLDESKEMLVRTKDDNAALRFDMREMKKERDELLEAKKVMLTQLEQLRETTQPNAEMVKELSMKKREMSGQMAALESELRTSRNEAAELRQEMLVKTETASVLSAQITAIQKKGTVVSHSDMQRYQMLETDLAKVSSRYSDLERSLDAHNEMLREESGKVEKMREDNEALRREREGLKRTVEGLEGEVKEHKRRNRDIEEELRLLTGRKTKRIRGPPFSKNTEELADDILKVQNDKTIKSTLGRLVTTNSATNSSLRQTLKKNKSLEGTIKMLSDKVNYLMLEQRDARAKMARSHIKRNEIGRMLDSQRKQNGELHKRLGELFDRGREGGSDSGINVSGGAAQSQFYDVRTVLERSIFNYHVKKQKEVPDRVVEPTKPFELVYIDGNDASTSTLLYGGKGAGYYDLRIRQGMSESVRTKCNDIVRRYQVKNFIKTVSVEVAERLLNVLNFSYNVEKEAASMCSELRSDLLGACGVIDELKKSLVKGGERLEGEREGKMKSVMKYVQEGFDSTTATTLRLSSSYLDDETFNSVCSQILTSDPSCKPAAINQELPEGGCVEAIIAKDNFLTDLSCDSLTDVLKNSQILKMIDLRGNCISNSGISALKSAALANITIEKVESRKDGVIVCTRDVDFDGGNLVIDVRNNEEGREDEAAALLDRGVIEVLVEGLEEIRMRCRNEKNGVGVVAGGGKGAKGGRRKVGGRIGGFRKTVGGSRSGSSSSRNRGVKKAGGFGNDFIDYALTEPPSHMPLVKTSAFLTQGADVLIGKETGGKGGEKWAKKDGEDSVAMSAAAASDAPPGERELGNLLEKKIKLMERRAKAKKQQQQVGGGLGGSGGGQRRWASSSGGSRIAPGGRVRARPKSAGVTSKTIFGGGGGSGGSGIRRPPKSTLRGGGGGRPKSAVLRRLPFGR
ncbi:hypothetical protein TrST_g1044 [Triparma strigata]|uniref:Uncharacterized protein n=1 Tax=Triparma strigata TaxID=1606541 RepID=A0A9W7A1I6_9STRA|nr:hypothetical protein TrST_g1044 [Triparma strigata]